MKFETENSWSRFYSNDDSVCNEVFTVENFPLALQSPGHQSQVRSATISPSDCLDPESQFQRRALTKIMMITSVTAMKTMTVTF